MRRMPPQMSVQTAVVVRTTVKLQATQKPLPARPGDSLNTQALLRASLALCLAAIVTCAFPLRRFSFYPHFHARRAGFPRSPCVLALGLTWNPLRSAASDTGSRRRAASPRSRAEAGCCPEFGYLYSRFRFEERDGRISQCDVFRMSLGWRIQEGHQVFLRVTRGGCPPTRSPNLGTSFYSDVTVSRPLLGGRTLVLP